MNEEKMQDYAENYMEKVFYFCLKKTGNSHEAEDLTSDISLSILSALRRGTKVEHFSAWVWQIAHNRYRIWAEKKRRHSENVADAEGFEALDEQEEPAESMIHREDMALLRRELAFISSDYRNIVAMYYLENRKVNDIAEHLGVPKGTVVSRLHRARNLLKEGMSMTREFGKRSYQPERFRFSVICERRGDSGQPWCYMNAKLHQNIYLEGYDDPKTAEAFALELGVALPYMEDELERLTRATLLVKNGNQYETAFPIISRDALWKIHIYYKDLMPRLVPLLEENIDRFTAQYKESGLSYFGTYQPYEEAKWTLLLMVYRDLYTMCKDSPKIPLGNTKRPARGIWDVYATEDAEFLPSQVGFTNVADGLYQYLFSYRDMEKKRHMPIAAEAIALCNLVRGEPYDKAHMEKLVSYGYVERVGKRDIPKIAVFCRESDKNFLEFCEKRQFSKTFSEHANARKALHESILALLSEMNKTVYDILCHDLPKNIRKNEEMMRALLHTYCGLGGSFTLGYILETALADGWLTYDENTPPTVGVYVRI